MRDARGRRREWAWVVVVLAVIALIPLSWAICWTFFGALGAVGAPMAPMMGGMWLWRLAWMLLVFALLVVLLVVALKSAATAGGGKPPGGSPSSD